MHISKTTLLWYIVPIVLFFAVVLLFFTKPVDITKTTLNFSAEPLSPNVGLQLMPGEKYIYEYKLSGVQANITYTVLGLFGDCMGVRADAAAVEAAASSSVCINMETGAVRANELATDFFQPWMLSLSDNFSWRSTSRITYPPPIEFDDATLRTISALGREEFRGRPAFKVRSVSMRVINGETANILEADMWVDEEKRVLLGSESELFTIVLISAPFPLSNASSN
ncbi:MAG: hypothetical protein Q7T16_05725 [Candidatus Burarchaeum sp.]|nr:hypothetical protein [Candidatus Burarchaeum sp.]MDO8340125.1 hypothetical protein [Candidatus Burarchaeum sp.]